jgi:apolipoprotein N-acyltransferase
MMVNVGAILIVACFGILLIGPEALSQARLSLAVLRRPPLAPQQWRALLRRFARWCLRSLAYSAASALGIAAMLTLLPLLPQILHLRGQSVSGILGAILSGFWFCWIGILAVGGLAIVLGSLLGLFLYAALRIAAAWHARAQPRREV